MRRRGGAPCDGEGGRRVTATRSSDARLKVESSNTRPGDKSVTPAPGWEDPAELRFVRRRGYVINIKTGEVLSSVVADVRRERGR